MTYGYYKCDRCETFEKGPIKLGPSRNYFAHEKYRQLTYGHRTGDDNSGGDIKTIDLCEDCRKALTEWLNDD